MKAKPRNKKFYTGADELLKQLLPVKFWKPVSIGIILITLVLFILTSITFIYKEHGSLSDFWTHWILQNQYEVLFLDSKFYPDDRYEVTAEDSIKYWYAVHLTEIKIKNNLKTETILIDSIKVFYKENSLLYDIEGPPQIPPGKTYHYMMKTNRIGDDSLLILSIKKVNQKIIVYTDFDVRTLTLPFIVRHKGKDQKEQIFDTVWSK